jgi:hypothetical protein
MIADLFVSPQKFPQKGFGQAHAAAGLDHYMILDAGPRLRLVQSPSLEDHPCTFTS